MFVMYQDCVSPHQVPLARELVARLGAENFRYVYRDKAQADRVKLGWKMSGEESWFVHIGSNPVNARNILDNSDVLLSGMRDLKLFESRCAKGLKTFYSSERWFKPVAFKFLRWHIMLPGRIRMLIPSYRRMAKAYACWLNRDQNACYLAIGPWAKKDMLAIGVKPEKIHDWGYFVEPSATSSSPLHGQSTLPLQLHATTKELRVLWVGRPLWWKRVDTIRKAVSLVSGATLDVFTNIPISQVREEMRKHDVYVLASNAMEGWGAALSEALSEGMICFGTYEAGASAALLPDAQLFHAGDYKELAKKLSALQFQLSTSTISKEYTPKGAAECLLNV